MFFGSIALFCKNISINTYDMIMSQTTYNKHSHSVVRDNDYHITLRNIEINQKHSRQVLIAYHIHIKEYVACEDPFI